MIIVIAGVALFVMGIVSEFFEEEAAIHKKEKAAKERAKAAKARKKKK